MISNALNSVKTAGCCASLYNAGATGANWLSTNTRNLASNAATTAKSVWASVSEFFSMIAQKLGAFFTAAKDATVAGYGKAKEAFMALPKEAKIAGAIGILASIVATAVCCKCFSKKEEKPADAAVVAAVVPAAQVAVQPAAQVAVQPAVQPALPAVVPAAAP